MKPLGQKAVRFPSKIDLHPKKPASNWWEVGGNNDENVPAARQGAKKEIRRETEALARTGLPQSQGGNR